MKFPNKNAFITGTLDNDDEWSQTEEILGVDGNPTCYEQKPAEWSKNDTVFLNEIIDFFENKTVRLQHDLEMYAHWLKSLPLNLKKKNEDVANLCSKEWSDEDEEMLGKVLECIRFAEDHYQLEKEETNGISVKLWLLGHIIPQPTQEWSEEDEEALDMCLDAIPKRWKTKSGILLTKWLKDNIHPQSKP